MVEIWTWLNLAKHCRSVAASQIKRRRALIGLPGLAPVHQFVFHLLDRELAHAMRSAAFSKTPGNAPECLRQQFTLGSPNALPLLCM